MLILNVEQVSCSVFLLSVKAGQGKTIWAKSHVAPMKLGKMLLDHR